MSVCEKLPGRFPHVQRALTSAECARSVFTIALNFCLLHVSGVGAIVTSSTFPHLPPHICTPGRRTYVDPEHSRFTPVRLKLDTRLNARQRPTLAREQCQQQLSRRMAVLTLNSLNQT